MGGSRWVEQPLRPVLRAKLDQLLLVQVLDETFQFSTGSREIGSWIAVDQGYIQAILKSDNQTLLKFLIKIVKFFKGFI